MSKRTPPPEAKKIVRCAVYTRKSTEEGLQQEFNSLDAQRKSAEAFVAAQKHEGWACLPDCYDDGGFFTFPSLSGSLVEKWQLRPSFTLTDGLFPPGRTKRSPLGA